MKDIPLKEEKLGLESSLTPHCSKISSSKKNIVHHVLIGDKNPINFGRNDFPPSCPRPATKRVSRLHCQISWSSSKEIYHLKVTGANGLKYCGNFYGPGDFLNITSGTIIDFVGLKVLFIDSESSESVKQNQISPNYETTSTPLSSCPLITHESQNFAESTHEDSTLGNISFALENSYEVLKSSNVLSPKKKLSQNNSELSLEKKIFGDDEDFEFKENGKTNQILTDDLLSCLDESEDAKLPRKKKQKRALEASSPKASNKDKYFKKGDSFDKADFSEESLKQSVKASSEALSEDVLSDEPTPVIEMLDKDTAQPDDETFIDLVLQTLVGMGKRTPVALKPLLDELLRVQHNSELTPEYLAFRLAQFPMFIKVPALGPFPEVKNDQYYYSPELDWNPSRKVEIGTLVRKPRGCTLSSKQYYFKPLPKLPKYKGPGYKKTQ